MIMLTANRLTVNSYTTHETCFLLQSRTNENQYIRIRIYTDGAPKRS